MKRKVWILPLVVVLTAALYYGMQTPTFALFRLTRAAQSRDLATFYSYVDLGAVIDSIEDAESARRNRQEAKSEWQALAGTVGNNLNKILKPKQRELLQREIEGKFRKSQLPDAADAVYGQLLPTRNFFREVHSFDIGAVARRGDEALANLEVLVPKLKKSYALILVLRHDGEWKVSGLEGLASTLDEYAIDRETHVKQYNEQVAGKLMQALSCSVTIQKNEQLLGLQKTMTWQLVCQNTLPETVQAFKAHIELLAADGKVLKEFPVQRAGLDWKSNTQQTWSQQEDIGLFDRSGGHAFSDPNLRYGLIPEELQFSTGAFLRPAQNYEEAE